MSKLEFLGRYSELKAHGYKFQKLYAANYMQWSYGDFNHRIRIWKKGNSVELDNSLGLNREIAQVICGPDFESYFQPALPGLPGEGYYVFLLDLQEKRVVDLEHKPSLYREFVFTKNHWFPLHLREMKERGWIDPSC